MYYIIYLYYISILDIYRYTFSLAKFFVIDSFVMLPYYLLIGNVIGKYECSCCCAIFIFTRLRFRSSLSIFVRNVTNISVT